MSASNWDVLAFNESAENSVGIISGFEEETFCSIYKDYVSVTYKGEDFFASVRSGKSSIAGFNIIVEEAPQDGSFIQITTWNDKEIKRLAAVACYGYVEPDALICEEEGLDPRKWRIWCQEFRTEVPPIQTVFHLHERGNVENTKTVCRPLGDEKYCSRWVGVLPETYQKFIAWLEEKAYRGNDKDYQQWVEKIKVTSPLRLNQGDMWLAKILEEDPFEKATAPGECEYPILYSFLNK